MDRERFDAWSRLLTRGSRRAALAALLGAALLPPAAALPAAPGKKKGKSKRKAGQVTVCHSGETLRVPRYAVRAVLRDGGRRGACAPGGLGGGTCEEELKRGQTCERSCQCLGDLRCDAPRDTPEQRENCGQAPRAERVCCLAAPDACRNDCECCGGQICVDGTCRPGCREEGACCPGGRCRNGRCVPTYATLGDCQGRCDSLSHPATVTVCGEELRCPGCGQCQALGCSGTFVIGTTTSGTATYCVPSTTPVGSCSQSNLCPQGQICNLFRGDCVAICRLA